MTKSLGQLISYFISNHRRIWFASLITVVLFGLFAFEVSHTLLDTTLSTEMKSALQAVIVGIGAGAATWFVLHGLLQRRTMIKEELHRVGELNHTIRTSLSIIVLAHHSESNKAHREMILDCTRKIDEKLKQLFPTANFPKGKAPESTSENRSTVPR